MLVVLVLVEERIIQDQIQNNNKNRHGRGGRGTGGGGNTSDNTSLNTVTATITEPTSGSDNDNLITPSVDEQDIKVGFDEMNKERHRKEEGNERGGSNDTTST